MVKRSRVWVSGLLVVLAASTTIAAEVNTTTGTNARKPNATDIVEHNFDPEAVADAVVVYNPMVRHALDKMEPFERVLAGRAKHRRRGATHTIPV